MRPRMRLPLLWERLRNGSRSHVAAVPLAGGERGHGNEQQNSRSKRAHRTLVDGDNM